MADAERAARPAKPGRARQPQALDQPKPGENSHTRLRRELLTKPGHWAVLRTSVQLNQAAARRLARAYTHAKPGRLDPDATGAFHARPFQHEGTWHIAVSYQPAEKPENETS